MALSHESANGASSARHSDRSLEPTILNRLGDVTRFHIRFAGKVRNRARDFENAVITPCGQPEPTNCAAQQIRAGAIGNAVSVDFVRRETRIRCSLTGKLACARVRDAHLNRCGWLPGWSTREIFRRDSGHFELEVDTIEQRTRNTIGSALRGQAYSGSDSCSGRENRRDTDSSRRPVETPQEIRLGVRHVTR
jgi:hypothetical protein